MTDQPRPTLARRQLGRTLRRLRLEAGKTHEDVRTAGLGSRSKTSLIEAGRQTAKAGDIHGLASLYGLTHGQRDQLLALAEAGKRTGIHESLDSSMPERFGIYGDLVDAAVLLRIHSAEVVHGLLQTEEYARAIIGADIRLTPDGIEQRVAFRLRRQAAYLRRAEPGRLEVVITAGALGLVVGSPSVMEAQLDHLRRADATKEVNVRVLTATNGVYSPMSASFVLMDFDDPEDPPVAYVPNLVDTRYLERPDFVAAYREVFDTVSHLSVPLREYRP